MTIVTTTVRMKLTRVMIATIMAALQTGSIIPALLEVGQSLNAFFVNVTKCKASASAALLYPFPTYSHINLPLIYCSHD